MTRGERRKTAKGPVLVHGFTGSSRSWDGPIISGLREAGFGSVAVDLPGHGPRRGPPPGREASGPPTADHSHAATPEARPDDLAGAVPGTVSTSVSGAPLEVALGVIGDAVKLCSPTDCGAGSAPADLVGYSMGGRVALHFAARYPDRVGRLVLESASPGLADPGDCAARRAADARLARRISMSPIEDFVKYWEDTPLFESQRRLPPAVRARQQKVRLANDPQGIADALLGLGTGRLPAIWDRLPTIATPTLLIAGKLDAKFVAIAERMVGRMPNARIAVVEGVGHAVHLEKPEGWLAEVTEFLGRGVPE